MAISMVDGIAKAKTEKELKTEKCRQARQNRIDGFNAAAEAHKAFLKGMNFDSPGTSGTEETYGGGWHDYVSRALEAARKIKKKGI